MVGQKSLERASFSAVVVTGLGAALRLALQILLSNSLGTAGYGRVVLGRSWGEVLARLPSRGLEAAALKELPRYREFGSHSLFRGYVRTATAKALVGGISLTVLAIGVVRIAGRSNDVVLFWGLALITPLALLLLLTNLLQSDHRFVTGAILIEIAQPALYAVTLGTMWFFGWLTPASVMASWVATVLIVYLAGRFEYERLLPNAFRDATPEFDKAGWKSIGQHLFSSQLAFLVIENAGVLILGIVGGVEDVAIYAVASRLSRLVRILDTGVQSNAASWLSTAGSKQDWNEMQTIVDRSLRIGAVPSLVLATITGLAAPILVSIFGSGFSDSALVLQILLLGNAVNAVTGPSVFVVSLGGLEKLYSHAIVAIAAFAIVVVTIGALWGGVTGAAIASASITALWNVAIVGIAWRCIGVRCFLRPSIFKTPRSKA